FGRCMAFAAISKLDADCGSSACRVESVHPSLLRDVVRHQNVERRSYRAVVSAVKSLIDVERLLQVGLRLRGSPSLAEQSRIVLKGKRRIGMVAAEYLLEDGEGPQVVRLRLVQLPLRSIEARQIVTDYAHLPAVRAKDLLKKRECLKEPLLGLRKAPLELVERGEVLQCRGYVRTLRVELGLENP